MQTRKLGRDGPTVSSIGYGCMGMTSACDGPSPDEAVLSNPVPDRRKIASQSMTTSIVPLVGRPLGIDSWEECGSARQNIARGDHQRVFFGQRDCLRSV